MTALEKDSLRGEHILLTLFTNTTSSITKNVNHEIHFATAFNS